MMRDNREKSRNIIDPSRYKYNPYGEIVPIDTPGENNDDPNDINYGGTGLDQADIVDTN